MIHNHPWGDQTTSWVDIQMTQAIVKIAKSIAIAMYDQNIVCIAGKASLKGSQLI